MSSLVNYFFNSRDPSGKALISSSSDQKVKIWSLESSVDLATLGDNNDTPLTDKTVSLRHNYTFDHEHEKSVRSISIAKHSNNLLIFGSFDSTISIWKLNRSLAGKNEYDCITILEGHENEVKCVEFHPEENILASCSRDKSVWLWDYDEELEFECLETLNDHDQDVKMVKWVPYQYEEASDIEKLPSFRKRMLASASYDNTIKVFTIDEDDEYYCFQTLKNHSNIVWSLCFSNNGELMFSSSEDSTVKVWKYSKEKENSTEPGKYEMAVNLSGYHDRAIYSCDYSDKYNLLASAGGDDTLVIYQVLLNGDEV